jgi:hypothetical protein
MGDHSGAGDHSGMPPMGDHSGAGDHSGMPPMGSHSGMPGDSGCDPNLAPDSGGCPDGFQGKPHHDGPGGPGHHDGPGGPGHHDGPPDCSTIPEPEGRALCETSQARGTPPTAAECATMPTEEGRNNCMEHVGGTP